EAVEGWSSALTQAWQVEDKLNEVTDRARDIMGSWEDDVRGAEEALGFLNEKRERGEELSEKEQRQYDILSGAIERYKGGVEDSKEAVVDAEVAKALYKETLDGLNQALADGKIDQEEYNKKVAEAAAELDPMLGLQGELMGSMDNLTGSIQDMVRELDVFVSKLLGVPPSIE